MARLKVSLCIAVMASFISACTTVPPAAETSEELIACGSDKVRIYTRNAEGQWRADWEWTAATSEGMPADYAQHFRTNDECKPVGDDRLLITSSAGGIALVDRASKDTLFYAYGANAHSAAYLPGDRIAVALSTAENGDALELYDVSKPEEVLFSDELYSGHGAEWREESQTLFALGFDELREYRLKDWDGPEPGLELINEWKTPDEGGHDLFLTADNRLLVTTNNSVWEFDIASSQFSEFEPLRDVKNVKSVNLNVDTGELVYTKGEIRWWTHNIYFENPQDLLTVEDMNLYKVRMN